MNMWRTGESNALDLKMICTKGACILVYDVRKKSGLLEPNSLVTFTPTKLISALVCFWGTPPPSHCGRQGVAGKVISSHKHFDTILKINCAFHGSYSFPWLNYGHIKVPGMAATLIRGFVNISESSFCLPGQPGSCITSVELSENSLQNLFSKQPPFLIGCGNEWLVSTWGL